MRFANILPRRDGLVLTFALRRSLESPRIRRVDRYGSRWFAHTVAIGAASDLDAAVHGWLRESHDTVGKQAG